MSSVAALLDKLDVSDGELTTLPLACPAGSSESNKFAMCRHEPALVQHNLVHLRGPSKTQLAGFPDLSATLADMSGLRCGATQAAVFCEATRTLEVAPR